MKQIIYASLISILFSLQAYSQWLPQNSGTTEMLRSVYFINVNAGWACGANGTIIKTTNGGLNWFSLNSGSASYLWGIQFIDINNGWAWGNNQILATTNGGTNWTVQNISGFITSLQFINENNGWLTISNSDSSKLYKTTNGGSNWVLILEIQNYYAGPVYFLNENFGWIVSSPGIFKTVNGGETWNYYNANLPSSPTDIQFVNNSTGWISTISLGSFSILKTTDGGLNWVDQLSEGLNSFIESISFPNLSTGYAAGWQMYTPPNPSKGYIRKTTDGGASWIEQHRSEGNLYSMFFIDEFVGWVVGANGRILYTENGGLPVELISFTAFINNNSIILNWSTATETNNKGFEIERQTSISSEWEKIAFINGYGTSTEIHSYSFVDKDINPGNYIYRLKQIDFDGSFEYSKEIEVEVNRLPIQFALYQNYPNPFNPATKIKYAVPSSLSFQERAGVRLFVELKVYDILGTEIATLVNEEKTPGYYEVEWNAGAIASGTYIYELRGGDFAARKKMLILK